MAKNSYKVTCDDVHAQKQTSVVRFVIEDKPVPVPGSPAVQRVAKTVINAMFADNKEALKYEVGKAYTITIE